MSEIKMVIGSWGSYNECNERALGSKWLDLSDYSNWEEIEEELTNEGFKLDGKDAELFIQDIEGLPSDCCNWDYTHPQKLFELLQEADVIDNNYNYDTMTAFLEVRSFDEFEDIANKVDKSPVINIGITLTFGNSFLPELTKSLKKRLFTIS